MQVTKAMPRLVENPLDRMPADSSLALSLARLGVKGERGYFQLITENNDTPKQVTDIIKGVTNIVLKVPLPCSTLWHENDLNQAKWWTRRGLIDGMLT